MGVVATDNAFYVCGDIALQGVTNFVKVVDDILISDENYPSHLQRIYDVLLK